MPDQSIIDIIREYFSTQPILRAWIFGSYARGEQTPDSDIDILVDFDHQNARITLFTLVEIADTLREKTSKEIDLVENGRMLPFAQRTADNDKLLIYERAN